MEKIIINDGKAMGVLVEGKELSYDIIISNILVQDLFKIADNKHFPEDYAKEIKSLAGTGSLCAYYSLKIIDPKLIGKTFHFIERNVGVEGNDVVGTTSLLFITAILKLLNSCSEERNLSSLFSSRFTKYSTKALRSGTLVNVPLVIALRLGIS